MEHFDTGFAVIDKNLILDTVDEVLSKYVGGKSYVSLDQTAYEQDADTLRQAVASLGRDEVKYVSYRISTPDGYRWVLAQLQYDKKEIVVRFQDIETINQKENVLDMLNKKSITDLAKQVIANRGEKEVYLGILDIDNFKNVNDQYGHMFGDQVLVAASNVIKECVAGKGTVGRMGGDEFMLLFDNVDDYQELRSILRGIRMGIESLYKGEKEGINISCSIGVAGYQSTNHDYEKYFRVADAMLYLAKDKGKNRYIIYEKDIHGPVVDNIENVETARLILNGISKGRFMQELMDKVLSHEQIDYTTFFGDIAKVFGLDEINFFAGNLEKPIIAWEKTPDGLAKNAIFAEDSELAKRYSDETGVAVINMRSLAGTGEITFNYMVEHGWLSVIIYRLRDKTKHGYIVFARKNELSRKWEDKDIWCLTMIGQLIENTI